MTGRRLERATAAHVVGQGAVDRHAALHGTGQVDPERHRRGALEREVAELEAAVGAAVPEPALEDVDGAQEVGGVAEVEVGGHPRRAGHRAPVVGALLVGGDQRVAVERHRAHRDQPGAEARVERRRDPPQADDVGRDHMRGQVAAQSQRAATGLGADRGRITSIARMSAAPSPVRALTSAAASVRVSWSESWSATLAGPPAVGGALRGVPRCAARRARHRLAARGHSPPTAEPAAAVSARASAVGAASATVRPDEMRRVRATWDVLGSGNRP